MSHVRSADTYYRSPNVSALRPNGQPCPETLAPSPPSPTTQVRSADKYYAHAPAQGIALTRVHHAQSVHPISVSADASIRDAVSTVLEKLASGQQVVHVEVVDLAVITKMRTQLELAVTQGKLTEDRYRDVKFVGTSVLSPPPGLLLAESSSMEKKGEAIASVFTDLLGVSEATIPSTLEPEVDPEPVVTESAVTETPEAPETEMIVEEDDEDADEDDDDSVG